MLFILDKERKESLFVIKLGDLRSKLISNSTPFVLQTTLTQVEISNTIYLSVIRCDESEIGYELDASISGAE